MVIDDTAVTPRYVIGLTPERELPIIWKIALGSLQEQIADPAARRDAARGLRCPGAITPLLMLGGAYLAFEATEKILEKSSATIMTKQSCSRRTRRRSSKQRQVAGAIRTDFILSAEIMAIALAQLDAT